ncbi:MAG: hypothetical protein M3331_04730 [Actinomycetota bacterium]|nr:hypothetical protein [Actinomycetota bacterium]
MCLTSLPSSASASPAPFGEAEAKQQLRQAERAQSASMPTDLTVALRDLALALPKLNGAAERRARSILARPPDGSGSADEARWPSNADEKLVEMPAFVVHYAEVPGCDASPPSPDPNCDEPDLADEDFNGIPDYVDATVAAVNESIAVENGELGWPLPKGDGQEGEPSGSSQENRFDVYLADLCDESDFDPCLFGYASPDDSSAECNGAPYLCSAHLVLDNDYASDEFGASGGELGLRVTTAHEYNHALQFNLDSNQDAWMLESTATWSEEKVFPDDDDWVRSYMDSWAERSLVPITKPKRRFYGSAVWNHWLENGDNSFGPDVVLSAWQSSREVTPNDYAVGAYDDAIEDEGGAGFPQEFAAFTAATSEWKSGDGSFPNASELPDVTRQDKIGLGDKSRKQVLDNTSYALFDVSPGGADSITLKGRSGGGVQWSVALVGRTGDRVSGTVDRRMAYSGGGERRSVTLADARSYDRITAVVTNADGHVSGKKPPFGEFNYTRNGEVFRLKVR